MGKLGRGQAWVWEPRAYSHAVLREELVSLLKAVPDLERVMARVHIGACKLKDFLEVLTAFERVRDTVGEWQASGLVARLGSQRLQQLLSTSFPDLSPPLADVLGSFDRKQAASEGGSGAVGQADRSDPSALGFMEPSRGAVPEYDEACATEKQLTKVGVVYWAQHVRGSYWMLDHEPTPARVPRAAEDEATKGQPS